MSLAFRLADQGDRYALAGDFGKAARAFSLAARAHRQTLALGRSLETDWLLIWEGKSSLCSLLANRGRTPLPWRSVRPQSTWANPVVN